MEHGRLWLALTFTGWGEVSGLGNFAYAVRDLALTVKKISTLSWVSCMSNSSNALGGSFSMHVQR